MKQFKANLTLKIILGVCLLLFILINIFPVLDSFDIYRYTTRHERFVFNEYPSQGTNIEMIERQWKHYLETNTTPDTILYRRFEKDPLRIWDWGEYLFAKRYRYPYLY
jgi:hypothetical protein